MLPITLQMSHVEVIWLLNWPSNESLLCWGGADARNGQKRRFLLNPPLLENFLVKNFSWVVPWERARTQLSEYVGHIGVHMIKNIVIAAQSQDRSAKVGSSRKIPDVKKKWCALNFWKKSLFLLREVFKWYLKNPLRRNKLFFKNWARINFFWHHLCQNFFSGFWPYFGGW